MCDDYNRNLNRDPYKEALLVQDACNLSGVVNSFCEILSWLWDTARAEHRGTDWVNTHPICVLFADKIASLAKANTNRVFEAYTECERKSGYNS